MSVSKWKWTEACDSKPCSGDCDECSEEEEDMDDITYCSKIYCKNEKCERHFANISEREYGRLISFSHFTECEFWKNESKVSGRNLSELNKLEEILKEQGILYERIDTGDRYGTPEMAIDFHQIRSTTPGGYKWDVVCHYGSYGAEEGLLEGMGAPFGADVEGYMTADDVIDRIKPFYKN